jgi:SAM-dependent methyltransferase
MQKGRTLQFWDDYHSNHDTQEWIAEPGEELSAMICQLLPLFGNGCVNRNDGITTEKKHTFRILEIGCGTSTLVRDLKAYMERHLDVHKVEVVACGTDVSPICIDICRQRDEALITKSLGTLQYKVLNVLENGEDTLDDGHDTRIRHWDLILDKGCLDTFLFRSRQRGENSVYPESVRRLLDNLHSWMGESYSPSSISSCYMLISPRSKLKAVRDYSGFESVQRHPLPFGAIKAAEIVKGASCNTSNDKSHHKTKPEGYLYVCHKNEAYVAGNFAPFRTVRRDLPAESSLCNRCHTTFSDFRNGEAVEGRGLVFWTREFKNHCIHCKG